MKRLALLLAAGLIAGPAFAAERHATSALAAGVAAKAGGTPVRRMPRRAELGQGEARCLFKVNTDGGINVVSVSGSSPAHAAMARQILESVHAPPPRRGAFYASQTFHFH